MRPGLEWTTHVAAAERQLRANSARHSRALSIPRERPIGRHRRPRTASQPERRRNERRHLQPCASHGLIWRASARAVSFGVWAFLASEALFFGGLFLGYAVYRNLYPDAFLTAARETEIFYGTLNTAILLTSSLTMAVAERGAQEGLRRMALWCLAVTALLGTRLPDLQRLRVPRRYYRRAWFRARVSAASGADADLLGVLLGDDRRACHPSDDRHRRCGDRHDVALAPEPAARKPGLRRHRALLAPGRRDLGHSAAAALPGGSHMNSAKSTAVHLWIVRVRSGSRWECFSPQP